MNSCNLLMLLSVYVAFVLYNGVDGRMKDISRDKIASQINVATNFAICGISEGKANFNGVTAKLAIYNPPVKNNQYSAAKLRLNNGPDSIEAGWRVDPTLYGDNQTHFFIRTDAGQSHCFNAQCPGFMVTDTSIALDSTFAQVSKRGQEIFTIAISIVHDLKDGNWNLLVGPAQKRVGFWPKSIFSASGFPNNVEFGGETFSPDGSKPRMGAGEFLLKDTKVDAFFSNVQVINESGAFVNPPPLGCISEDKYYETKDEKDTGSSFGYVIFYGGPGNQ